MWGRVQPNTPAFTDCSSSAWLVLSLSVSQYAPLSWLILCVKLPGPLGIPVVGSLWGILHEINVWTDNTE